MPGKKLCFSRVFACCLVERPWKCQVKSYAFARYLEWFPAFRFACPPGESQVKAGPPGFRQVDGGSAPGRCRPGFCQVKSSPTGRGPGRRPRIPTFPPRPPGVGRNSTMCDCLWLHLKLIFPTEQSVTRGAGVTGMLPFPLQNPTFTR